LALRACDLTDRKKLAGLLREWQPRVVYHLAGYAHVGRSFREPDAAWSGNLDATRSLLDALQDWGGNPRILLVSSGLIYGESEAHGRGCDERSLLRPESPYAASKAAADLLGYQVWRAAGLDVVRARPFNHVGPRQSAEFAVAHFARQIVEIERGCRPPVLETGDLHPRRDLTDVRDVVRGYLLVAEKSASGDVYNLGSGEAHSMGTILDRLRTLAGVRCEVRRQPGLLRDADTPVLRADASKARRELGWSSQIPLEQTLADVLAYWRKQP
ncbi:MAG TPA: GDP-mannose 4,6-dehydratase, partial [Gemmataceae bacterium]|nr:GDP-mannose 4,6-dehydratase [Gemmataceae bacterium]